MLKTFFKLSAFIMVFISPSYTQTESLQEIENLIKKAFQANYNRFYSMLNSENPYRLYNIEVYTINLIEAAGKTKDINLIDSLAALYNIALKDLISTDTYYLPYNQKIDTIKFKKPYKLWLNKTKYLTDSMYKDVNIEVILNSIQFSYAVTRTINLSLLFDNEQLNNTVNINKLADEYWDIIVNDQLYRWIFGEKLFNIESWGCIKGNYNHNELIDLKANEKFRKTVSHCKAITDCDLWIMACVAEILMINEKAPQRFPIADSLKNNFKEYLNKSLQLVKSRYYQVKVKDFNNTKTTALQFDIKAWIDHIDNRYARIETDSIPLNIKPKKLKKIGWDISHARRLVSCLNTFYNYNLIFNTGFPDSTDMKKIANNFAYNVFNGDFTNPLFSNYMDGTNGWYRLGYKCQNCGYGPYDLAISALTGGFFIWEKYNNDLKPLKTIMFKHIKENSGHWQKYYGRYFENGHKTEPVIPMNLKSFDSVILIEFLPVFLIVN
ncbi:MAG: hypothetical protein Kow0068_20690 [Marinilabiliales bacterium]